MMLMMPSSLDPYCWHKHFPSSFAISLGNRQHFAMIDTLLESATEWTTAKGNELNMQPNHFNEFNRLETASNTYRYWHVTHMCTRGGTPSKNETMILDKWLIATTLVVLSQNFKSRGALFSVSSDGFTVVMVVKGYGNSSWDKGLPTGFICRALLHGNSRKYSVWQRLCREILGLGYMQICDWKISLEVA